MSTPDLPSQASPDAAADAGSPRPYAQLTVYRARRIHTMDDSLPVATTLAVSEGRIVAVGDWDTVEPWLAGRDVTIDDRFADHVLMPGLIDNHIHPFLGAILLPTEHLAPEAWRQADGSVRPAIRDAKTYREQLVARAAAQTDRQALFVSFGYQPALHGRYDRAELDRLFANQPVILIQRSFHEFYVNSAALNKLGLSQSDIDGHAQIDWPRGHFYETGIKPLLTRLMPAIMTPGWYGRGLAQMLKLIQMGGVTTCADMLFGAVHPDFELGMLRQAVEGNQAPVRIVNVFDVRSFANRAAQTDPGPPDTPVDFANGLQQCATWQQRSSPQIWFSKAVKLFADGAMFSQLMQMGPPGYIDGHHGEWLMSPQVLADGVRAAWQQGWQIHTHVNGDGGMQAVLDALDAAQTTMPRFDHRFQMHHVGFHTAAQTARIAALGAHASVNPYYLHALGDDYGRIGLGPERANQLVRCGSLVRAGVRVSFHSDFMMAPIEPLFLAWCAASRQTREQKLASPSETLSLQQALRGITIDAAWALKLDHEIGSLVAGKRADLCVLIDDPYELGVDGLRDVRIAGTVFEGRVAMLPEPVASLHRPIDEAARGASVQARVAALEPKHYAASASSPEAGSLPTSDTPASAAPESGRFARYKPVSTACCGLWNDVCELGRRWSGWLHAAASRQHPIGPA